MRACQSCGCLMSVHSSDCPACGSAETDLERIEIEPAVHRGDAEQTLAVEEENLVAVARFNNSAEAGYFADELEHTQQIASKLKIEEHFDALNGRWWHDYVLLVAADHASRAAEYLTEEVTETADEAWRETPGESSDEEDVLKLTIHWAPILITTIAAGSVAYWGVKKVEQQPRPPALGMDHRDRADHVWGVIAESENPWVQRIGHGPGVRVLTPQPGGEILLQEDADGDGRFERRVRLRR